MNTKIKKFLKYLVITMVFAGLCALAYIFYYEASIISQETLLQNENTNKAIEFEIRKEKEHEVEIEHATQEAKEEIQLPIVKNECKCPSCNNKIYIQETYSLMNKIYKGGNISKELDTISNYNKCKIGTSYNRQLKGIIASSEDLRKLGDTLFENKKTINPMSHISAFNKKTEILQIQNDADFYNAVNLLADNIINLELQKAMYYVEICMDYNIKQEGLNLKMKNIKNDIELIQSSISCLEYSR